MEWLERMISTAIILIRTNGERSRPMTCLLLHVIDTFQLFIQDRSSFLEAMMGSTESMISLSTTLTTTLGKKFWLLMIMKCPQVHAILTQLLYLKTLCTSSEVMMAITRMISIDLTLLQIHGRRSKTLLESLLRPDIELHVQSFRKTCTCLEDMMDRNSLMIFTITISKRENGFKSILRDNKILHHETATFYSATITPFFCLEVLQETLNLISLSFD